VKRCEIIKYRKQLEYFLKQLRCVIWFALAFSLFLFISSIIFFYYKMLLNAALSATAAYFSFKAVSGSALSITKQWVRYKGGQEEMLLFLDKEMKGKKPREFFSLLERALTIIDK